MHNSIKPTIILSFLSAIVLFSFVSFAKADNSSVTLTATVLPMNDLDLSGINPDAGGNNAGLIKGVSTARGNDSSVEIIGLELSAVLFAFLFSVYVKKKKQASLQLDHNLVNNLA